MFNVDKAREKLMNVHRCWMAPLLGLVCICTPALAGTVTAQFNTVNPNQIIEFKYNGGPWEATYAGKFQWTRLGGTQAGNPTGNFVTFCIELTQEINFGGVYTYDVYNLDSAPTLGGGALAALRADRIRRLWGLDYNKIVDGSTAAAFQTAVWEISHDTDMNVLTGAFQARNWNGNSTAFLTTAQDWLNNLNQAGPLLPDIAAIVSPTQQDQIFYRSRAVPLPSAAAGGLVLLAGAILRKVIRRGA